MKPLLGLILTLSVASLFDIPAGAGEQPLKPGHSSFKDCADCPEMGSRHRLRGGSWASFEDEVRSANRSRAATGRRDGVISFRVGRTLNQ